MTGEDPDPGKERWSISDGPTRTDDATELYKAAYDEAARSLEDQLSELDSMRTRSVAFLAFVGSASAFLTGTALGNSEARPAGFFALASIATIITAAFVLSVISILLTLGPGMRSLKWRLRLSPGRLLEWIESSPVPTQQEFIRGLIVEYDAMLGHNRSNLRVLRAIYVVSLCLGMGQLVIWGWLAWMRG